MPQKWDLYSVSRRGPLSFYARDLKMEIGGLKIKLKLIFRIASTGDVMNLFQKGLNGPTNLQMILLVLLPGKSTGIAKYCENSGNVAVVDLHGHNADSDPNRNAHPDIIAQFSHAALFLPS